jgi:hypothetical protein
MMATLASIKSAFSTSTLCQQIRTLSNSRSVIVDQLRTLRGTSVSTDELRDIGMNIFTNFPDLTADFLAILKADSHKYAENVRNELSLLACDVLRRSTQSKSLLVLGETSAADSPDFAILDSIFQSAASHLDALKPSELVGILALAARLDFVDSNLNESTQEYLPGTIAKLSDNHLPIIFTSVLRLGIDQPIDRVPHGPAEDAVTPTQQLSSPLMVALIDEIIRRVPKISESGCLAILHSIVRRPKTKITKEMERLVNTISSDANISSWGLSLRIQAIHALSRLGVSDSGTIASLFADVTPDSVGRIPSANLQHLLSIIHNHASNHSPELWRPVINVCITRMADPVVGKSMSMATIAVTIGYMGRLNVRNERVLNFLLSTFGGIKSNPKHKITDNQFQKLITRTITDSQTDIGHLASMLEALERLQGWDCPLAVPLALLTRRLILRDGIHNIKAAPICLTTNVFVRNGFALSDSEVFSTDALIDDCISNIVDEQKLSLNWSLKSTTELVTAPGKDWRQRTVLTFLEGLLRHEQYIRSTASASDRCRGLRDFILANPGPTGIDWEKDVALSVRSFIDSLDQMPS